LNSACRSI